MIIHADERNLQKDKLHGNTSPLLVVWPDSILSLEKTHGNALGIFKKTPKVPSDSDKQDALVWWTSILSILYEETSSAHQLLSTIPKVKCAGSRLMLWGCFSAEGTKGLVRIEEKLNAQNIESLNESPENSEPQTGQNVHLPTGQWPKAHSKSGL